MKTAWILGFFVTGLTACGPLQEGNRASAAAQQLLQRVGAVAGESSTPGGTAGLTREQIEAAPIDLLRLSIISLEGTSLMSKAGENGSRVTWVSPDEIGAVFQEGLVIGTRGLGDDIMGSDVSGAIASLDSGGNHLRTLDFLNGLGQIERETFQCSTVHKRADEITIFERTYQTTIIEETCTSADNEFMNTYWRDFDGIVWQSRQWVSEGVGYLGYQRL